MYIVKIKLALQVKNNFIKRNYGFCYIALKRFYINPSA